MYRETKKKIKNIYLQHNGMCIHIRKQKKKYERKKKGEKKHYIHKKYLQRHFSLRVVRK